MLRKILGVVALSIFALASAALAGRVDLTTYYPSPDGQYTTLSSTGESSFATTAGQNVYIGYTQAAVLADATLQNVGTRTESDLFLSGNIAQDPWVTPALMTFGGITWAYFGAPYNRPGYFRDKNGIVHLKGLVKSGTVSTGVTGTGVPKGAIFQLPVGYRPVRREVRAVISNNTIGRVNIDTDGYVIALQGTNSFFSLDGITFRASGY
jgi:hypothetical protein